MTRLEAAVRWREKYPDRAGELRTVVRRYLGMSLHDATASQFARTTLDVAEAELLGVVYGLPPDPEPEPPPSSAPSAKREVIKALDLEEYPPSGRDRAAGE